MHKVMDHSKASHDAADVVDSGLILSCCHPESVYLDIYVIVGSVE